MAYPGGGRTKTMALAAWDVEEVAAALARYRAARDELDQAADAEIANLAARAVARRAERRR